MESKSTKEFEWMQKNFDRYKRELDLINKQNPYECEMYSVLAAVIRCCMNNNESISLRDVSRIPRYEKFHTENFFGGAGFPDFVVLEEKYKIGKELYGTNEKPQDVGILGAVEIKCLQIDLCSNKNGKLTDEAQVWEHIKYFRKVIYTNGLEWWFYGWDEKGIINEIPDNSEEIPEPSKIFELGTTVQENDIDMKINWNDESEWKELLNHLKRLQWK